MACTTEGAAHAPLPIALAVSDARKQALLRQLGVECDGEGVQIEAQEGSLDRLLLAARVHCLSKVRAGRGGAGRGGAGRGGWWVIKRAC